MQRIARLSRKNERRVQMLPIHLIDVNPYQPRSEFDDEAVRALASSIASLGLLQPITVRPETNGRYTLIAGERRLRACLRLGMQTIEAMLIDAGDGEAAMLALVEDNGARAAACGLEAIQIVAAIAVGAAVTSVCFRALARRSFAKTQRFR